MALDMRTLRSEKVKIFVSVRYKKINTFKWPKTVIWTASITVRRITRSMQRDKCRALATIHAVKLVLIIGFLATISRHCFGIIYFQNCVNANWRSRQYWLKLVLWSLDTICSVLFAKRDILIVRCLWGQ